MVENGKQIPVFRGFFSAFAERSTAAQVAGACWIVGPSFQNQFVVHTILIVRVRNREILARRWGWNPRARQHQLRGAEQQTRNTHPPRKEHHEERNLYKLKHPKKVTSRSTTLICSLRKTKNKLEQKDEDL
jgi:hypothetical protein